ncbi:hypothetical protein C8T65DRAFT_223092 [Cerioporus squamosus]|nr:hypothetical protein C8T65DRAFT_223092 [Cerioporus squamosus]
MGDSERKRRRTSWRAGVKSRVSGVPRRRRHLEAGLSGLVHHHLLPGLTRPSVFCSGSNTRPRGTSEPPKQPDCENQRLNQDPRSHPRFLCYNRYRDLREPPLPCCGQSHRLSCIRSHRLPFPGPALLTSPSDPCSARRQFDGFRRFARCDACTRASRCGRCELVTPLLFTLSIDQAVHASASGKELCRPGQCPSSTGMQISLYGLDETPCRFCILVRCAGNTHAVTTCLSCT